MFTNKRINMNASEKILQTYNKEELKEIADHGCQSGVCSQHIYYGDTIKFFDKYEDEIVDYIESNLGQDQLLDLFTNANFDLSCYKNDMTWCYIELVAMHIIDTTNEVESDAELVLTWQA